MFLFVVVSCGLVWCCVLTSAWPRVSWPRADDVRAAQRMLGLKDISSVLHPPSLLPSVSLSPSSFPPSPPLQQPSTPELGTRGRPVCASFLSSSSLSSFSFLAVPSLPVLPPNSFLLLLAVSFLYRFLFPFFPSFFRHYLPRSVHDLSLPSFLVPSLTSYLPSQPFSNSSLHTICPPPFLTPLPSPR